MTNYVYGNKNCRIQWVNEGFKEILNSAEAQKLVDEAADEIISVAGPHFEKKPGYYKKEGGKNKPGRVAALVRNKDSEGAYLQATEKALEKAVNACATT